MGVMPPLGDILSRSRPDVGRIAQSRSDRSSKEVAVVGAGSKATSGPILTAKSAQAPALTDATAPEEPSSPSTTASIATAGLAPSTSQPDAELPSAVTPTPDTLTFKADTSRIEAGKSAALLPAPALTAGPALVPPNHDQQVRSDPRQDMAAQATSPPATPSGSGPGTHSTTPSSSPPLKITQKSTPTGTKQASGKPPAPQKMWYK
jgi:hypothetical protein